MSKKKKYNKKTTTQNRTSPSKRRTKKTRKTTRKKLGLDKEFVAAYPVLAKVPILNWLFQSMYKEGWWHVIGMLVVSAIFLGFGLHHLGKFLITDEPIWYYQRTPQYWNALLAGDWIKTRASDKPGVFNSILAGLVTLKLNPQDYLGSNFPTFLFWWRLPILLFNFVCLFLSYHFLKQLANKDLALLSTALIATTPIITGMTKLVNPDSVLWSTCFISILTFLLYLKTDKRKYIFWSGSFFGFALLSKYNAQALFISYFGIWYLQYFFARIDRKQLLKKGLGLLGIFSLALGTVAILMPAAFVSPNIFWGATLETTFNNIPVAVLIGIILTEILIFQGKITGFISHKVNTHLLTMGSIQFSFFTVMFILLFYKLFMTESFFLLTVSTKQWSGAFFPMFFQSANALVASLRIPVLIGFMAFLAITLIPKLRPKFGKDIQLLEYFVLIIFLFFVGASLQGVSMHNRYQIMLFPLYIVLASSFFLAFIPKIKWVTIALVLLAVGDLVLLMPTSYVFYSNNRYKNPESIINWGIGGYEVAEKANEFPNVKNLKVLSDYHGFNSFFDGKSMLMDRVITQEFINNFDYLCVSSSGKSQKTRWKMMTSDLEKYYDTPFEETAAYNGSSTAGYIKLVKIKK